MKNIFILFMFLFIGCSEMEHINQSENFQFCGEGEYSGGEYFDIDKNMVFVNNYFAPNEVAFLKQRLSKLRIARSNILGVTIKYKTCDIVKIYMENINDYNNPTIVREATIIHELCHVLTGVTGHNKDWVDVVSPKIEKYCVDNNIIYKHDDKNCNCKVFVRNDRKLCRYSFYDCWISCYEIDNIDYSYGNTWLLRSAYVK